ncbi:MAG: hypothetical protein KAI90_07835, partial [Desulfobulbaceae bacterium]|nr:hypothetical protein [Desulfobulbaceae bacterium]
PPVTAYTVGAITVVWLPCFSITADETVSVSVHLSPERAILRMRAITSTLVCIALSGLGKR